MREFNSIVQEYPFNLLHDLYRKKEINIWEIKKFFKYQLYKHNWLFIIYQAKNIILNLRRL